MIEKEMIIFRFQLTLIIAIILSVVSVLTTVYLTLLSWLVFISGFYFIFHGKKILGEDWTAYLTLYAFFGLFALSIPFFANYLPLSLFAPTSFVSGILLVVFVLVSGLMLWKVRFGRNYTIGTVLLADQKLAGVLITYDVCSNTKGGNYVVSNPVKAKKGQKVKVLVKGGFFGSSRPYEIFEVIR